MQCDRMIGMFLLVASQYYLASMLDLHLVSWHMATLTKNTSAHCMQGYKICAAVGSSQHMHDLTASRGSLRLFPFEQCRTSDTSRRSSPAHRTNSSEDQRNSTPARSMPADLFTNLKRTQQIGAEARSKRTRTAPLPLCLVFRWAGPHST